ncbi:hypothetical protein E2C01_088672 [Portunus trituberculatus]|uniref:Uncharacterized protein n=1 Tax=Portunus trituberculatus TaxID=210409 RepID=A0A5B7JFA6_PORTR|nr:hypothetical protein [Portunus trituberculatus]
MVSAAGGCSVDQNNQDLYSLSVLACGVQRRHQGVHNIKETLHRRRVCRITWRCGPRHCQGRRTVLYITARAASQLAPGAARVAVVRERKCCVWSVAGVAPGQFTPAGSTKACSGLGDTPPGRVSLTRVVHHSVSNASLLTGPWCCADTAPSHHRHTATLHSHTHCATHGHSSPPQFNILGAFFLARPRAAPEFPAPRPAGPRLTQRWSSPASCP